MKKHERAAEKYFLKSLKRYIEDSAHVHRGLSEEEYIYICKKLWYSVETDDVFAMKVFVEPLSNFEGWPARSDFIHCILIARSDADGNIVMPKNYDRNDPENVFYASVCVGAPETVPTDEPDNSKYLIGFFDIAGFKNMILNRTVSEIHSLYLSLIKNAVDPLQSSWVKSKALNSEGQFVPALMWCPIEVSYASDSILISAPFSEDSPGFIEEFFKRCALLFCASIRCGAPLRGAISVGPGVFDIKKRIFLGPPLVEASSLESKMDFIGVAIAKSMQKIAHIPVPLVHISDPPLNAGGSDFFGGLVLDWPRIWRETFEDSAEKYLSEMCIDGLPEQIRARYQYAIEFFHFSDANSDWFNPEGYEENRPDDWSEFS